jgi:signal transduction histidine kinase/ActR/RegA family two-component response regulator
MPETPFVVRLTEHRDALIERFLREVENRDVAPDGVVGSALRDSLPDLFVQIVSALGKNQAGSLVVPALPAAAEHGIHRWRQGFDVRAVVREYGILENVVYKDLEEQAIQPSLREVRAFQNCLNAGLADAITAFTEFTEIEDRERTDARVEAAREEGERLNRMKDDFLATVSHELRTPLQSILGWARLLRSSHVSPEQVHRALESIERNALVQVQLIEDILDVSRIVTGKARIHSHQVDLAMVLGAALDTTQPVARAKGVELAAAVPSDIGTVMGDSDRLQQVIGNLLSNAVKFTQPGGHVRLTANRTPTALRIVVTDDGQGISPSFLPFVFDRFRQAEAGVARSHGGLGLGLAIVRHLVELHGGRVDAQSEGVGKGAMFTVELPVAAVLQFEPPVTRGRARGTEPAFEPRLELQGLRILVVDDQSDARELTATILREYGAEVRVAEGSDTALRILMVEAFDVLVSDIGMPISDGYVLIRTVRAVDGRRPDLARLPAVALTAYAHPEDEKQALASGYDLHVAKPVDPKRLVSVVLELTPRSVPVH